MRTIPLAISSASDGAGRPDIASCVHRNDCNCNGCARNRARIEPPAVRRSSFAILRSVLALLAVAAPALAQQKITLDEAVRRATARNPTALVAEQEIRRADGIPKEGRAPALPTLTANGIATRNDAERDLAGRPNVPLSSRSANLNLTVPLFVPQRWLAWSHAGDQVDIA